MPYCRNAVPPEAPSATAWNTFRSYAAGESPVDELEMVGSALRSVEQVTGRMTSNSSAPSGVASGATIGLFVGLLVGLSTGASRLALLLVGLPIGAAWGAGFVPTVRCLNRGHHNSIALDGTAIRARAALGLAGHS